MDRLQAMQVFTRVVDTNSFTRAAETLDLPRASVTTIIQNLEAFSARGSCTAPRGACRSRRTARRVVACALVTLGAVLIRI
ncbi:MAG: Probable transcription regulator protein of MDR efflux pump cluster [uncultured Paraburkholderia sp.]|nr:MAG: Probable transcription regulator protein of MDR efflux pump cluster [uncultured Paraburkholderia sp.]